MKRIGLVVACMIATLTASAARAQESSAGGANALVAGAKSLSFAVPGGGNRYANGAAGLWYMISDDMNLGINVGLGIDRNEGAGGDTTTNWDVLLAPAIRYYMAKGVVNPYFLGQVNLRFHDTNGDDDPELGIAGGIGAEWFPVRNFSIGGEAGVGIDIIRSGTGEPVRLGTFQSALVANIYWE